MPRIYRPSPLPSRLVRSAGALVWRFADRDRVAVPGQIIHPKDIEVLIVHRPKYKDWSWPKGKTEPNEPIISAAVREVEEETGYAVTLGAPLTTQRYRLGSGQTKEVHYWIGTVISEQLDAPDAPARRTRMPVHIASSAEIDTKRWVSPGKADAMLTRRGDRRLLSELLARAQEGKLITSTFILARHAKAESRGSWNGSEATRPLTRFGGRQAVDLVDFLSAFGVQNAYSSPWTRCVQTLAPWASIGGVNVCELPELTETAVEAHPLRARQFLEGLLRHSPAPLVVCVHRPTIPTLLEPMIERAPASLRTAFPSVNPWLTTAQLLVMHVGYQSGKANVLAVEQHATRTKDKK